MRSGLAQLCTGTVISAALTTSAWAGAALDDDKQASSGEASEIQCDPTGAGGANCHTPSDKEKEVEYGVAFRLRSVHVPQSVLELFVEHAAGGASNVGYGLEMIRRRGTTELQLGFEFEHLTVGEGVWINKGENVAAGDEADFILSPEHSGQDLGWFTIEFTFMNHAEINKYLSFRYGGGAGLGIITGELHHYNIVCNGATNSNPEPGCVPPDSRFNGTGSYSEGTQTEVKYDLPPVFPVVNAIIGLQIKPTDKMVVNIETGIRTLPFFGISVGYFL
jgi:hypothetical protein